MTGPGPNNVSLCTQNFIVQEERGKLLQRAHLEREKREVSARATPIIGFVYFTTVKTVFGTRLEGTFWPDC